MAEESGNDALVTFLESLGATRDQIETARRECSLARLPADLVLSKDATVIAMRLLNPLAIASVLCRVCSSVGVGVHGDGGLKSHIGGSSASRQSAETDRDG